MPRTRKGTPPKYRHHKASGQAVVTIAGKDVYLGEYGSESSRTRYADLIQSSPDASGVRGSITCRQLLQAWLREAKSYPETTRKLFQDAFRDLLTLYGDSPASSFDRKRLAQVREVWIIRDLARSTINQRCSRIKQVFSWAIEDDRALIPDATVANLNLFKALRKHRSQARETEPVRPVPVDDLNDTLDELSGSVLLLVRVQLLTGCRPGELLSLRWEDIDQGEQVWRVDLSKHKTRHHGHSRTILLGPKAKAILIPWMKRSGLIFPTRLGTPYTTRTYRNRIIDACDRANATRWHPNQLRHNRASDIRSKYGLEAAQVLLGHRNARITEVYAERDLTLLEKITLEQG